MGGVVEGLQVQIGVLVVTRNFLWIIYQIFQLELALEKRRGEETREEERKGGERRRGKERRGEG